MRYATIDANSVVVQIVDWDGETDWSPPEGETLVPLPDDELFVEARGTLDPETLEFVRYEPTDEERAADRAAAAALAPPSPATVQRISALVDVLIEKGTITPDDVQAVDTKLG